MAALIRLDARLAIFFQIPDVEMRIKAYKYTFLLSFFVMMMLYWSCGEVNNNLNWGQK